MQRPPRRSVVFILVALGAAAIFARLGIWQLQRLHERRARNALMGKRLVAAPVPFTQLPADSAAAHYRRVTVVGLADYTNEVVLADRSYQGSPGVNILTPVLVPGDSAAVLVNRGWVYSPDGSTVDLSRWHEGDTLRVEGYVEEFVNDATRRVVPASQGSAAIMRRVSRVQLASIVPYPLAPVYVMAIRVGDGTVAGHPARFGIPSLDEGPHLGYAIQWFAFAAIAIAGSAVVLFRKV